MGVVYYLISAFFCSKVVYPPCMLRGMFNGVVVVSNHGVVALVLLLVGEDEVVRPLVEAACIFTFIPPSHICAYPPVC